MEIWGVKLISTQVVVEVEVGVELDIVFCFRPILELSWPAGTS